MPRRNRNAHKRGIKRPGKHGKQKAAPLTPLSLHPRKKTGKRPV